MDQPNAGSISYDQCRARNVLQATAKALTRCQGSAAFFPDAQRVMVVKKAELTLPRNSSKFEFLVCCLAGRKATV